MGRPETCAKVVQAKDIFLSLRLIPGKAKSNNSGIEPKRECKSRE